MRHILFLIAFVFIGFGWLSIVPIWHTPDEQAHFGQVAFIARTGRNPTSDDVFDSTEEIKISEELLGTKRDNLGNNRFTFHPDYKIEYTDSFIGKYEASISGLSLATKENMVFSESSKYPRMYYIPASFIYSLLFNKDLFLRVFAVRTWSTLLYLCSVLFTYLLGRELFGINTQKQKILTLLVGLQPMFVFSSIGVTSDSIGNLLFTCFLWISTILINRGFNLTLMAFLLLTTVLAIFAKPQFIILAPIFLILFLFLFLINKKIKNNHIILLVGTVVFGIILLAQISHGPFSIFNIFIKNLNLASLYKFTTEYSIRHMISEVLPWYWGIYDWLGVTYPRSIHRIINRILFISIVGFIIWLFQKLKRKNSNKKILFSIFFFLGVNLLFTLSIFFYDWLAWYLWKYQLGIQGRYFFPLISTHMIVILLGWETLFFFNKRLQNISLRVLGVAMALLNLYGFYTIAKTYYDISSFQRFLLQASQYKPDFMKGIFFGAIIFFYLASLIYLSLDTLLPKNNKKSDVI